MASRKKVCMTTNLVFYCLLNKANTHHILELNSFTLSSAFGPQRNVNVAPHLALLHICFTDFESFEQILKLLNGKFAICWMMNLGFRDNLEERHTCSIIVDIADLLIIMEALGRVLLHLYPLNCQLRRLMMAIEVPQHSVLHDGVVLLRDLVALRQISIKVMLPIKLDLGSNVPLKREGAEKSDVQTLRVQHRQHPRQSQVHHVSMDVRF
jgi:hypothetical protein